MILLMRTLKVNSHTCRGPWSVPWRLPDRWFRVHGMRTCPWCLPGFGSLFPIWITLPSLEARGEAESALFCSSPLLNGDGGGVEGDGEQMGSGVVGVGGNCSQDVIGDAIL